MHGVYVHTHRGVENDQIDGHLNVPFLLHIRYMLPRIDVQMGGMSILRSSYSE